MIRQVVAGDFMNAEFRMQNSDTDAFAATGCKALRCSCLTVARLV